MTENLNVYAVRLGNWVELRATKGTIKRLVTSTTKITTQKKQVGHKPITPSAANNWQYYEFLYEEEKVPVTIRSVTHVGGRVITTIPLKTFGSLTGQIIRKDGAVKLNEPAATLFLSMRKGKVCERRKKLPYASFLTT